MTYPTTWPDGTRRSTDNAFTLGHGDTAVVWAPLSTSEKLSTISASNVRRRREEGTDNSTFHGLSNKSDEIHAQQVRARRMPSRMPTPAKKDGAPMQPDSKSGQMRKLLEAGPMTRQQLADAVGIPPNHVSGLLANDRMRGRIVSTPTPDGPHRFALVKATS